MIISDMIIGFAWLVLVLLAMLAIYSTVIEPFRPVIRTAVVKVPHDWPAFSVLHLSDIHVRTGAHWLYRAQTRFLRSLPAAPDLICVTGDVCEQLADTDRAAALIKLVTPRYGTMVILGNHEHNAPLPRTLRQSQPPILQFMDAFVSQKIRASHRSAGSHEAAAIAEAFREHGLTVLVNEGRRLQIGEQSLWVAGVDSSWAGRARSGAALQGRREGEPTLALVHEPETAISFVARGVPLALAGHTHGGQVKFPFFGALYSHKTDPRITVASGFQRLGHALLHTSPGFGQTIPLRFNCPPEVTWITCVPDANIPSGVIAAELQSRS